MSNAVAPKRALEIAEELLKRFDNSELFTYEYEGAAPKASYEAEAIRKEMFILVHAFLNQNKPLTDEFCPALFDKYGTREGEKIANLREKIAAFIRFINRFYL